MQPVPLGIVSKEMSGRSNGWGYCARATVLWNTPPPNVRSQHHADDRNTATPIQSVWRAKKKSVWRAKKNLCGGRDGGRPLGRCSHRHPCSLLNAYRGACVTLWNDSNRVALSPPSLKLHLTSYCWVILRFYGQSVWRIEDFGHLFWCFSELSTFCLNCIELLVQ